MATKLIGILNVTPDSFSDGGLWLSPTQAIDHAQKMISEGADILDIGAESTRPGALPITAEEEWRRLKPVLPEIIALGRQHAVAISLDTRHAETAKKAIACGVSWINDVGGLKEPMLAVLAAHQGPVVLMHSLGIPANPQETVPAHADIIETLKQFISERLEILEKRQIDRSRIVFDPGIGFGKSVVQNMQILLRWQELREMNLPILIGHSRKSFLAKISGDSPAHRDAATLSCSLFLIGQEIDFLRVHEVSKHVTLRHLFDGGKAGATSSDLDKAAM